jgi:hypothetical protein
MCIFEIQTTFCVTKITLKMMLPKYFIFPFIIAVSEAGIHLRTLNYKQKKAPGRFRRHIVVFEFYLFNFPGITTIQQIINTKYFAGIFSM